MITVDTITEALKGTEARYTSGTGWYSNGHFAVRGEQWAAAFGECDLKPNVAVSMEDFAKLPTTPVLEVPELRIARIIANERCPCGDGRINHDDCEDCTGHQCDDCEGSGLLLDVVKDSGQAVFTANGHDTVIKPQYARLLEGLTIARNNADAPARAILLAYDESGQLCAAVMPFVVEVRQPVSQ